MSGPDLWNARTPYDRMMDKIAAASSVHEIDRLWRQAQHEFAVDPKLRDLEVMLAANRRPLAARR